ncbi:proline racemase family protein [Nesterenkonia halophila]
MTYDRLFHCVETHSGEPMRVITGGLPDVPGSTVYEQAQWLERHADGIRKLMLREPRGYPPLCCNLIVPAKHPDAAAGFIVMEQTEYPMMSGGNTIAVATVLLETGILTMEEPVTRFTLETPGGLVEVQAQCEGGRVTNVTFQNIPAFSVYSDVTIEVPELGQVIVDVAWGGMFYVIADISQFASLRLSPEHGRAITRTAALILRAAQDQLPVEHPDYPGVGITIAQLSETAGDDWRTDGRNAVMVASGEIDFEDPSTWTGSIDRCACGTGTSAKMAALHAKGRLPLNTPFRYEGILGITYVGELVEETRVGDRTAVVPTISGQAWITGFTQYVLQHDDPFPEGFAVGDIWPPTVESHGSLRDRSSTYERLLGELHHPA